MRTPQQIAAQLIRNMEMDSGVPKGGMLAALKDEYRAEFTRKLEDGVARMQKAGCRFTKRQIEFCAMGNMDEVPSRFAKYDGYIEVDAALNKIFDPQADWVKQ